MLKIHHGLHRLLPRLHRLRFGHSPTSVWRPRPILRTRSRSLLPSNWICYQIYDSSSEGKLHFQLNVLQNCRHWTKYLVKFVFSRFQFTRPLWRVSTSPPPYIKPSTKQNIRLNTRHKLFPNMSPLLNINLNTLLKLSTKPNIKPSTKLNIQQKLSINPSTLPKLNTKLSTSQRIKSNIRLKSNTRHNMSQKLLTGPRFNTKLNTKHNIRLLPSQCHSMLLFVRKSKATTDSLIYHWIYQRLITKILLHLDSSNDLITILKGNYNNNSDMSNILQWLQNLTSLLFD